MNEPIAAEKLSVDRLEAMFFQLVQLYDRCTQERQLFGKEKEEFGKLSQLLVNQIKEIGKIETTIRKSTQDGIQISANLAMDRIAESFMKNGHDSIEKIIDKIEKRHQLIEAMIDTFQRKKNQASWKMMGFTLLSSIITSLFAIWFLLPKPMLPLTSEQLNYLRDGQMLAQIWPDLSDAEKSHLKNIAGKILHSR